MTDAHDEAARALREQHQKECTAEMLSLRYLGSNGVDSQPRMDKLFDERCAAALRKAAADEREACAVICSAMSVSETSYGQPVAARQLLWVAELIRARAKGGATSVPASGIHERAEGHPKSCTCSYCEVGR